MRVKFSDVVKRANTKEDRFNSDKEYYVGGEHMFTGEYLVTQRGIIAESNIGPMFYFGFKKGQVLLASRSPDLKKAGMATFDGICSEKTFVIETKDEKVLLQSFLPAIVRSESFWKYANDNQSGSVNHFINWSTFANYEFDLPDIETQKKLSDLLWAMERTKSAYKDLIAKTDDLVKSQFIEMFGDPIDNPKGLPVLPLKSLATKLGSGATPKGGNASYKTEGISLIRSMHVYNGYFDYEDLAYIDDEQAKKLDNVTVCEGDVLLNITGASVARSCVVPNDILPARVNQHVCIIRCRDEMILPVFLNRLLIGDSFQTLLWNIAEAAGATRQALTKEQIENLRIIVPPVEQQRQYIQLVEQSDKSKFAAQQALANLSAAQKALMRQYLG